MHPHVDMPSLVCCGGKAGRRFLERGGFKLRRPSERRAPANRPRAPQSVHVLYVFISSHGYQLGLCRSTSSLHSCLSLPPHFSTPSILNPPLSKSISDISGWTVRCNPLPYFLQKPHQSLRLSCKVAAKPE